MDCHGFSYDIVEVNSVTKKELGWSSYKKVPIILMGNDEKSLVIVELTNQRLNINILPPATK